MSELYSIKQETLTDIADALRRRHGETEWVTVEELVSIPATKVSKTPNAAGFDSLVGEYEKLSGDYYDVVTIDGASSLKVTMAYRGDTNLSGGTIHDYVQVAAGNLSSMPSDATKYAGRTIKTIELTFENTDTVTFHYFSNSQTNEPFGYYAEVIGLDAEGNALSARYEMQEVEKEVKKTFTSAEMAGAIDAIEVGETLPEEVFRINRNCDYMFAQGSWDWFVELFGERITTGDIQSANGMFLNTELTEIPFDLNLYSAGKPTISNIFQYADNLIKVPYVKGLISGIQYAFNSCYNLREIPEDWADYIDWSYMHSYGYCGLSNVFNTCYSLRKIPDTLISNLWGTGTSATYVPYSAMCSYCYVLDEVVNLPIQQATLTSNRCSNMLNDCSRLKRFTFATKEDGTPYTAQWKAQTIDLSAKVGYLGLASYTTYILNYNSGITADKQVTDDATYQALKDDPDWFTTNAAYSRYNKTSALETIYSLPDTSAYGTNTIKFAGTAGSATDGGAINTLTEEEIAVATAKGWTVTFA